MDILFTNLLTNQSHRRVLSNQRRPGVVAVLFCCGRDGVMFKIGLYSVMFTFQSDMTISDSFEISPNISEASQASQARHTLQESCNILTNEANARDHTRWQKQFEFSSAWCMVCSEVTSRTRLTLPVSSKREPTQQGRAGRPDAGGY